MTLTKPPKYLHISVALLLECSIKLDNLPFSSSAKSTQCEVGKTAQDKKTFSAHLKIDWRYFSSHKGDVLGLASLRIGSIRF